MVKAFKGHAKNRMKQTDGQPVSRTDERLSLAVPMSANAVDIFFNKVIVICRIAVSTRISTPVH